MVRLVTISRLLNGKPAAFRVTSLISGRRPRLGSGATVKRRAREALYAAFRASGREVRKLPPALLENPENRLVIDLEHLIAHRLLAGTDLFVVQIGAFDGRTGDQLHPWIARYGWRGVLVEPHPRSFAELQRTYATHPGLELRCVAISEKQETRTLYAIRDGVTGLPVWAPQVATFDRARLDSHGLRGPNGEDVVEQFRVQCVPLRDVLGDVDRVDLLQVDVEGYDAEIIRMFDFERYHPSIVRFESKHLSHADHNAAIKRLLDYGYRVEVTAGDTLAWDGSRLFERRAT